MIFPLLSTICPNFHITLRYGSLQTVWDAVLACRAINIQWLWVDVLCIIQDDPVDKFQEIAQMGNIFRSAILTLVAATASRSDEGFLNSTSSEARQPFQRFAFPCPDGHTGSIYLIKHPPEQERFAIESRGYNDYSLLVCSSFHPEDLTGSILGLVGRF
jgi:hypothetical protein